MAKTNRIQIVYSQQLWTEQGSYLTKKGEKLKAEGASEEILSKYRKIRYVQNPNAYPIKTISHLPQYKNW